MKKSEMGAVDKIAQNADFAQCGRPKIQILPPLGSLGLV